MRQWMHHVEIPKPGFSISYQTPVVSLGSCFAEHIGQRLIDQLFPTVLNPMGIVYNPASMLACVKRLVDGRHFEANEVFKHEGLWHSFLHHGRFSHPDQNETLALMNAELEKGAAQIRDAEVMLITLGTAWIYRHNETGEVVNNNHKLPNHQFTRELLSVHQVADLLREMFDLVRTVNKKARWICTVSPVRHLKDGAAGNNRSKAHLLAALHEVMDQADNAYYFPGHEILLDELRDYRFYQTDFAHPSSEAIEYIWERFGNTFFESKTEKVVREVEQLLSDKAHRPLHPGTPQVHSFAQSRLKHIEELQKRHAFLNLGSFKEHFLQLLQV